MCIYVIRDVDKDRLLYSDLIERMLTPAAPTAVRADDKVKIFIAVAPIGEQVSLP